MVHSDVKEPIPEYVAPVEENPYDNPDYPPEDPNPGQMIFNS